MGKWDIGSIHFLILVIIVVATSFFFANPGLIYGQSVEIPVTAEACPPDKLCDPTWENFPLKPLEFKDLFPKEKFGEGSEGCRDWKDPELRFQKLYFLNSKLGETKIINIKKDIINPTVFIDNFSCLKASRTQIAIYDEWAPVGKLVKFSCGEERIIGTSTTESIAETYEKTTVKSHEFSWTAGGTAGVEIEAGPFTFSGEGEYSQTTTDSLSNTYRNELSITIESNNEEGYTSRAGPEPGEDGIGIKKKVTTLQKVVHVKQSAWKGVTLNPGENWNTPQVNPSIVSNANLYKYSSSFCKQSDWVGGYPNMPSCVPNELRVEFQRIEKYGEEKLFDGRSSLGDKFDDSKYPNFLQVHQRIYSDIRDFTLEKIADQFLHNDGIHPGLVTSVPGIIKDRVLEFKYSLAYKSIENPNTLIGFTNVVQEIPTQDAEEFNLSRKYDCRKGNILEIVKPQPKQKLDIWMTPSLGHTQVIVTVQAAPTDLRNLVVEDAEVIVDAYSFPLVKDQKTCFSAKSKMTTDNYGAVYFVLGQQKEITCNLFPSPEIGIMVKEFENKTEGGGTPLGQVSSSPLQEITVTHPDHLTTTVQLVWENSLWKTDQVFAMPIEPTLPDDGETLPVEPTLQDDGLKASELSIPDWVKDTAGWWSERSVDDSDFTGGIAYLIEEDIISIPDLPAATVAVEENVPDWVRNMAGWWANNLTTDQEFADAIKFLVEKGIIQVQT